MQESVLHIIPTEDLLDSNKSTISGKYNFADLLVWRDEIIELFLNGRNRDFLRLTNKYPSRPIDSPIYGESAFILGEIIPIVKKFYMEQGSFTLA